MSPGPGGKPGKGAGRGPASGAAPGLAILCVKGSEAFIGPVVDGLSPHTPLELVVAERGEDFLAAVERHPQIWIEWGHDLAAALTNQARERLAGKRVFVRIHHFEVFTGLADRLDYRAVTDLIFVCRHFRDVFLARRPEVREQVPRIHVIPTGLDLARFGFRERTPGHNLAYVGYLNYKKAPMVLMHAFYALHRADPRFRLHVAGKFQDPPFEAACRWFLEANRLTDAVTFYDWVADMPAWLADKHFLISTSLSESQGLGIMEAMATGCLPLVNHFPGAETIYNHRHLWRNLDELAALAARGGDPRQARRFIEVNYGLADMNARLQTMWNSGEEVVFPGPVWPGWG
ncbi:MAG: glycosyltransferase family 4 protein [Deltaproteobacteria bacterium]|nr:glycosyltransferase family 4 protein [Deltaproteobacteria bacterium]